MGILPSWMDDGTKMAWASSVIMESNGLPKSTTIGSVSEAALNAAYLGLQFGKSLGFAYMLPFGNRKLSEQAGYKVYDAVLCIGYRGFVELGLRAEFLAKANADIVCGDEPFRMWTDETGKHFSHEPNADRDPNRKNVTGAYCTYTTKLGGSEFTYVSRKQIDKVDKGDDVWKSDYPAMCMKTAVRRAAKFWRQTPQLAHAVYIDEQPERHERQSLPDNLAGLLPDEPLAPPAITMSLEEFEANVMRCKTTADLESIEASLDKLSTADRQSGLDVYDRRYAMFSAME